ncbi:antitoxin, partial [Rhizobium ruizarguesonis]
RHQAPIPPREAQLFRNPKSQAVRIPAYFKLPGDRVLIHRAGDRLILAPLPRHPLLSFLSCFSPLFPSSPFPSLAAPL